VALSCNPATGRPGEADDLRSGQLLDGHLRRTGVRTKPGVDMDSGEESSVSRSTKDGRNGSGGKLSSQKAARRCSSRIAPVSRCRSAARPIQSHVHLFTGDYIYGIHTIGHMSRCFENCFLNKTRTITNCYKPEP
jgi:hypothetical protein